MVRRLTGLALALALAAVIVPGAVWAFCFDDPTPECCATDEGACPMRSKGSRSADCCSSPSSLPSAPAVQTDRPGPSAGIPLGPAGASVFAGAPDAPVDAGVDRLLDSGRVPLFTLHASYLI